MNELYGPENIIRQRSSGYRSTTHAIAEIVDNSIDAGATEISIILHEEKVPLSNTSSTRLTKIFVIDNGSGMSENTLNSCLTFAKGTGGGEGKIGMFGYGLPNSTIATCRRGDVYSREENGPWRQVYLDIDEIRNAASSKYPAAQEINEPSVPFQTLIPDFGTVVKWSELDKCDAALAKTMSDRCCELLGRIYRYWLAEEKIKISIGIHSDSNQSLSQSIAVTPSDPLYLTTVKTPISEAVWKMAGDTEGKYRDSKVPLEDKEYDPAYHMRQLTKGHTRSSGTHEPLFMPLNSHHDIPFPIKLGQQTHQITIRAAHATRAVKVPGRKKAGGLPVGIELGKKMNGSRTFRGGNIYFIREGRELDSGSFGLYRAQEEKFRFWTIEIHFTQELDDLLGVSNTKQSVNFKMWDEDHKPDSRDQLSESEQRSLLFWELTRICKDCIREMNAILDSYYASFKTTLDAAMKQTKPGETGGKIPSLEGSVLRWMPRGEPWSAKQKEAIINFLKDNYASVKKSEITKQVDKAAEGLTETIVLYSPNQTGNLFSLEPAGQGKYLTVFNTEHPYYEKVISPLKGDPYLSVFATVIEMLISSFALEQKNLIDRYEHFEQPLDAFVKRASAQLQMFLDMAKIEIDPEAIKDHFAAKE